MITTRIAKILMKMIKSCGHLVHKSTEEHIISTTENLHICTIFPNLGHWCIVIMLIKFIWDTYIFFLGPWCVYYCLQLFTLNSTLTLIGSLLGTLLGPYVQNPPTTANLILAQGPTYLNTVPADIGVDLAGRNPDGFAGIQSLRSYGF